jgi:hypothetical protein
MNLDGNCFNCIAHTQGNTHLKSIRLQDFVREGPYGRIEIKVNLKGLTDNTKKPKVT